MLVSRRTLLSAIALPFSGALPDPLDCRKPASPVALAPLLADAESEDEDATERFGAIAWGETVSCVYARCRAEICALLFEAACDLTDEPLGFSWSRHGDAWVLFVDTPLPDLLERLRGMVPRGWEQATDHPHRVKWCPNGKGGAR